MPGEIRTRRWDDPRRPGDGLRVLVCRYRPRALPKADETWDVWWKDLAPSVALHAARYGKGQAPIDDAEYRRRFLREMAVEPGRSRLLAAAERVLAGETITLLCSSACTDEGRCHRTLLRALLVAGTEVVTRLDDPTARTLDAHLGTTGRRVRMRFAASTTASGVAYLLARTPDVGWLRDVRHDPLVELAIDGRTFVGIARVIDDAGEARTARRLVEQKYRDTTATGWSDASVPVAVALVAEL